MTVSISPKTIATEQERKLLPCPFCGTTEGLYPGYRWPGGGKPYQIDCCGCGIEFTPREGMDVVAAWNRRSLPAPPRAPLILDDFQEFDNDWFFDIAGRGDEGLETGR